MEKINRFPGSRPFTKEFKDLFFGRKHDILDLEKYVMVEKLTVMYGKSGLGKSSLINAGLVPVIEQKFNIIYVRFGNYTDQSKILPVDILKFKLLEFNEKTTFLNKIENEDISLWQILKNIQLNNPDKEGILLIFDQFEELFTYPTGVQEFIKEFADVLNNKIPRNFRRALNYKFQENPDILTEDEMALVDERINLKVLMSIRSDRMSNLNKMSEFIPNILRNCYELKPLNKEQAKEAIVEPSQKNGNFISPKFVIEYQTIDKIVNYLADNINGEIETFQLQSICQYIEDILVIKNNKLNIFCDDLPEFSQIFKIYYHNLIDSFENSDEKKLVRELFEDKLIDFQSKRRISLDEIIITNAGITTKTLHKLIASHLVRSEPNSLQGLSYELSHDTLVEPIYSIKEKRIEEEKRAEEIRLKNEQIRQAFDKALAEKKERETERKKQRKRMMLIFGVSLLFLGVGIWGIVQMKIADDNLAKTKELIEKLKQEQNQKMMLEYNKYLSLGDALCEKKDYENAINNFRTSISFTIDSTEALNKINKATVLLKVKNECDSLVKIGSFKEEKGEEAWCEALSFYKNVLFLDSLHTEAKKCNANLEEQINSRIEYYNKKLEKLGSYPEIVKDIEEKLKIINCE